MRLAFTYIFLGSKSSDFCRQIIFIMNRSVSRKKKKQAEPTLDHQYQEFNHVLKHCIQVLDRKTQLKIKAGFYFNQIPPAAGVFLIQTIIKRFPGSAGLLVRKDVSITHVCNMVQQALSLAAGFSLDTLIGEDALENVIGVAGDHVELPDDLKDRIETWVDEKLKTNIDQQCGVRYSNLSVRDQENIAGYAILLCKLAKAIPPVDIKQIVIEYVIIKANIEDGDRFASEGTFFVRKLWKAATELSTSIHSRTGNALDSCVRVEDFISFTDAIGEENIRLRHEFVQNIRDGIVRTLRVAIRTAETEGNDKLKVEDIIRMIGPEIAPLTTTVQTTLRNLEICDIDIMGMAEQYFALSGMSTRSRDENEALEDAADA